MLTFATKPFARTLAAVWLAACCQTALAADDFFAKHVAPILETRCLSCHSANKARGKLALDSLDGLKRGGENGAVIEPGKPGESLLLEMVRGDQPEMPQDGPPLSADQVAALEKWIATGATWPDGVTLADKSVSETWWSLKPLERPSIPATRSAWPRNEVDRFVLAELTARQLEPSPEADRRTLIRRLSFDLHGLPPTPEAVEAFVNDPSPDAYERLVDQLLASPRYGERWARRWLDIVHFGETHGYDKDKRRDHAWPYRDYVIASFNNDKKYEQFVREQLAGDKLAPNDPQSVIATGFIAAGPWDFVGHVELREDTVEKAKTRALDRDDMVASTISTFVSMTAHCARCHDHKFDPIPQVDYYRLQAVFAGAERGDRPYDDPDLIRQRETLTAQRDRARAELKALGDQVAKLSSPELVALDSTTDRLKSELAGVPDPLARPVDAPVTSPTNGYHSAIAAKPDTAKWVQVDLGSEQNIDLIRLLPARPTDFPDTPGFGFPVRFLVQVADDAEFAQARTIADHRAEDFANPGAQPVAFYLEGVQGRYVRVTAERLWQRTGDYVFALGELQVESDGRNVARGANVTALDSIDGGRWGTKQLVDGFDSRFELPDLAVSPAAEQLKQRTQITEQLVRHALDRAKLVASLVPDELRKRINRAEAALADSEKEIKSLPESALVYAVKSREPRTIHVLDRGNVEQPLVEVQPGALSAVAGVPSEFQLANMADEASRRAALANWITHRDNMLAWRSIVNRVWHYHFGRGLVDTPNDLGRNGSRPTHPQLLDWLAVEFRDGGQSFKALDRLLVTSAAYRQQTRHNEEAAKIDGGNQYLWRANRQRLDAESFRDAVLATTGKLDLKMGGPSFELFAFKDDHSPRYDPVPMDEPRVWRRTIYRYITRSVPNPFLETLDCPDPSFSAPVRGQTITALQALTTLNNSLVLKQSEHFAERLEREMQSTATRLDRAYVLAFGRLPTDDERTAAIAYVDQYGLPNFCRLLFNANEFLFVD